MYALSLGVASPLPRVALPWAHAAVVLLVQQRHLGVEVAGTAVACALGLGVARGGVLASRPSPLSYFRLHHS